MAPEWRSYHQHGHCTRPQAVARRFRWRRIKESARLYLRSCQPDKLHRSTLGRRQEFESLEKSALRQVPRLPQELHTNSGRIQFEHRDLIKTIKLMY